MAKTTAELALIYERIDERLATARKDIDEYWTALEQMRKEQTKDRLDLQTISTTLDSLKQEMADVKSGVKELTTTMTNQDNLLRDKQSSLQSQLDKTEQRLTDHMAAYEKWDGRRWAIIGFFIGGLVNVAITLARK